MRVKEFVVHTQPSACRGHVLHVCSVIMVLEVALIVSEDDIPDFNSLSKSKSEFSGIVRLEQNSIS